MSTPTSPVDPSSGPTRLPTRTSTTTTTMSDNRRNSVSDDEAIPDEDSTETTKLLVERLRALKHVCGFVEDYVSVTGKVQRSQSKDYEKILKVFPKCSMCLRARRANWVDGERAHEGAASLQSGRWWCCGDV